MQSTPTLTSVPTIGDHFGPDMIVVSSTMIRDYVNSMGDESFAAHQALMRTVFQDLVAPSTILDRIVGTRLAATRYRNEYALHAKQSFSFNKPILVGHTYVVEGRLSDIYERNAIKYFTISATVIDERSEKVLSSEYTRAFQFPNNRHPSKAFTPLTLKSFLSDAHIDSPDFPNVGTVIQGSPRKLTQGLMNLYSGPGANIHTDAQAAAIRGHARPIVQGLMALSLECELFRSIFGQAWYSSGSIGTRFIRPILAESVLTPWAVVTESTNGQLRLTSGAFDQDGVAVTISEANVSLA